MKSEDTELLLILICAWAFYGACQEDLGVPVIAAIAATFFYFARNFLASSKKLTLKLSWRTVLVVSLAGGWFWRAIIPPPAVVCPIFLKTIAMLQTGSIIAAVLVWLNPASPGRSYCLRLLAWITVAISGNIAFQGKVTVSFWIFCAVNMVFVLSLFWQRPRAKVYESQRTRPPGDYAFPLLFIAITFSATLAVARAIQTSDVFFCNFVNRYIFPFNQDSFLGERTKIVLGGSGPGGFRIKPLLEVERAKEQRLYLRTQVFEKYSGGVWEACGAVQVHPLPQVPSPAVGGDPLPQGTVPSVSAVSLRIFEPLGHIIPVPRGVVAAKDKGDALVIDVNGIVYGTTVKNARRLKISFDSKELPFAVRGDETEKLLAVPDGIKSALKEHVGRIIGSETEPLGKARAIERYFKDNFGYSTNAVFPRGDKALLTMLDEKRAAYCTYFASAMVLMLREQGIPARLATGFLAKEVTGLRKDRFLVRLRDAHAWVEALLPPGGSSLRNTGQAYGSSLWRWERFDPTPDAAYLEAGNFFDKAVDLIWRMWLMVKLEFFCLDVRTVLKLILALIIILNVARALKKFFLQWAGVKGSRVLRNHISGRRETSHLEVLYVRYVELLRTGFGIDRRDEETDEELLVRLRAQKAASAEIIEKARAFLGRYRAARFGGQSDGGLEPAFVDLSIFILSGEA